MPGDVPWGWEVSEAKDAAIERSIEVRRQDIRDWAEIHEKARAEGDWKLMAIAARELERYREDIEHLRQGGFSQ